MWKRQDLLFGVHRCSHVQCKIFMKAFEPKPGYPFSFLALVCRQPDPAMYRWQKCLLGQVELEKTWDRKLVGVILEWVDPKTMH